MRKRFLVLISIVILYLLTIQCVFCGENDARIWFYTDNGSSWNVESVNLSRTYYLPTYSTPYDKSTGLENVQNVGNVENGTYARKVNVVGNIGCAYTGHDIKFTIYTDGRFESQSDPTKYVNFYAALKPRCRYTGGTDDDNYLWDPATDSAVDGSTRVPNTNNASHSASAVGPGITLNDRLRPISSSETKYLVKYYCDILVCIDPLTSEDLMHVAEATDYFARIEISWSCQNTNCEDPTHSGSYSLVVRGYYGNPDTGDPKKVFMFVNPDPASMNLDILNILKDLKQAPSGQYYYGEHKIADLNLIALTYNTKWQNLKVYVSSRRETDNNNASKFYLNNISNPSSGLSIPFSIEIRSPDGTTKTFDGTDKSSTSNKISLDGTWYSILNKGGSQNYSLDYTGEVYIQIKNQFLGSVTITRTDPETGEPISQTTVNGADTTITDFVATYGSKAISGIYSTDIYYHVYMP